MFIFGVKYSQQEKELCICLHILTGQTKLCVCGCVGVWVCVCVCVGVCVCSVCVMVCLYSFVHSLHRHKELESNQPLLVANQQKWLTDRIKMPPSHSSWPLATNQST